MLWDANGILLDVSSRSSGEGKEVFHTAQKIQAKFNVFCLMPSLL